MIDLFFKTHPGKMGCVFFGRIQDTGYRMMDTGCGIQDDGNTDDTDNAEDTDVGYLRIEY
jgi:hypothetical protein